MNAIHIEYDNERVKRYFTDYDQMKRKIGQEYTRMVKKRMDALNASECFNDFLLLGLGKPHILQGNLSMCYGVSISGNVRLIVQPICADLSPASLKECKTVNVKGVADYHGSKINWFIP